MHSGGLRGKKPVRGKLLALAIGLVLALAGAEIGMRSVLRLRGKPFDSAAIESELTLLVGKLNESLRTQGQNKDPQLSAETATAQVLLHPYLGFDWTHFVDIMAREAQYFRSSEYERYTTVLIVGGSVAASFGSKGWKGLDEGMKESPHFNSKPIRFLSHGRGGYKQPQQVIDVVYCLSSGFKPDIVLNLDGFNESALPSLNIVGHANPVYPSVPHWAHLTSNPVLDRAALDELLVMRSAQIAAQRTLDTAVSKGFLRSAVVSYAVRRRILELRSDYVASYESYTKHTVATRGLAATGPPPPEDWEEGMELALVNWKESSRSIAALCRERGIMYLHALQPTLHDVGSKPLTPEEVQTSQAHPAWVRGVAYSYSKMRELGTELRNEDVAFVDASGVFKDATQPLYYDLCHFTLEGQYILGRFIAKELIALADARAAAGGDAGGADVDAARAAEQARLRAARLERAEQRKQRAKEKRDNQPPLDDGGGG